MEKPQIKLATPNDWELHKQIRIKSLKSEDALMLGGTIKKIQESIQRENLKTEDEWRKNLSSTNKMTYLVKNGNEVIGISRAENNNDDGVWVLCNTYIEKKFQGKGIGKKLLATRIKEIINRGGTKARSYIRVSNKKSLSVALYFEGKIVKRIPALIKYKMIKNNWKVIEFNLTDPKIIKKINDILG